MDQVSLSGATADALSLLDLGDFYKSNAPERMAYVVLVLKKLDDRPEWFPKGKWATIQEIERQLHACADEQAEAINTGAQHEC